MNYSLVRIRIEKPNTELSLNSKSQCNRCDKREQEFFLDMSFSIPIEGTITLLTLVLIYFFR